ncbi:UNVERIFIED_CONTAM: hypothetical protein Sradi_6831900, partial [Sesamum radiatum]
MIQAIPSYVMSCCKILDGFLSKTESMTVNFFWQQDSERKIHWVAWRTVCKRKEKGRLGFRSLKELNMAILCKQAWQLETDLDSLLHHML